jgi:hypothetical protein
MSERKYADLTPEEIATATADGIANVQPGDNTDPDLAYLRGCVERGEVHAHDALGQVLVQWGQPHIDGVTPDVSDPEFGKLLAVAGPKCALEGAAALAKFAALVGEIASLF